MCIVIYIKSVVLVHLFNNEKLGRKMLVLILKPYVQGSKIFKFCLSPVNIKYLSVSHIQWILYTNNGIKNSKYERF